MANYWGKVVDSPKVASIKRHNAMIEEAIKHGLQDRSYHTVANGEIEDYRGYAEFTFEGAKYKTEIKGVDGTDAFVLSGGSVKFVKR